MKVVLFLLGLLAAIASLTMLIGGLSPLVTGTGISHDLIDSKWDKLFFALMVGGCGLVYSVVSVYLFKGWNIRQPRPALYVGMVCMFLFLAGLYYCAMFNSPW
jgi:hypothetical protein